MVDNDIDTIVYNLLNNSVFFIEYMPPEPGLESSIKGGPKHASEKRRNQQHNKKSNLCRLLLAAGTTR
jgi:hypothetical protein